MRPPTWQVQLHYHEEVIREARAAQKTPEQKRALRERLRPRAKVERKISEVLRLHGLRQGRYFGLKKTDLQAVIPFRSIDVIESPPPPLPTMSSR